MRDSVKTVIDSVKSLDDLIRLESAFFRRDYDALRKLTGLSSHCPILKIVNAALDELEERFGLTEDENASLYKER